MKIVEKAIKNKFESLESKLLASGSCKKRESQQRTILPMYSMKYYGLEEREVREECKLHSMWRKRMIASIRLNSFIFLKRVTDEDKEHLVNLIKSYCENQQIKIGQT